MLIEAERRISFEDDAAQIARLRQVLVWLIALAVGLAPVDIALGFLTGSAVFYGVGAVSVGMGCIALVAIGLTRRAQLRAASLTTAGALLTASVILAAILPALTTAMALVPVLAVAMLVTYLSSRAVLVLSVVAVLAIIAIFLIGNLLPPLLAPPPREASILIGTLAVGAASTLTFLLIWHFSARQGIAIRRAREGNQALQQARDDLDRQVRERTADLNMALSDLQARAQAQARLLEENERQRLLMREMSVPVLPISAATMVIPLIGALDTDRLLTLQEQALAAIQNGRARHMLLDITGVPVVDTQVAQGLLSIVRAARMLGTEVVLVGVRPEVAQAVVSLGLDLSGVPTRRSLEDGLAYTRRLAA
jgi:rsbT co-antagonist protein RsbR